MTSFHYNMDDILEKVQNKEITPDEALYIVNDLLSINQNNKDNLENLIFTTINWAQSEYKANKEKISHIILFDVEQDEVWDFFKSISINIVLVKPSTQYRKVDNFSFEVDYKDAGDYLRLFDDLKTQGIPYNHLLFRWCEKLSGKEESINQENLEYGVLAILRLTKALMQKRPQGKVRLMAPYTIVEQEKPEIEGLSGFGKTLRMENPNFIYSTLRLQDNAESAKAGQIFLDELVCADEETEVMYSDGIRYIKRMQEIFPQSLANQESFLKTHGVYIITGGAGGLGLIFASYLTQKYKARVVLTGRSTLDEKRLGVIDSLGTQGGEAVYVPCDITVRSDVNNLVKFCENKYGIINGVLHSAGVIKDSYIFNKSEEDMKLVLAPKIFGTLFLDEELKDENLDFFAVFSSVASLTGNLGQCDYAYANGFMDSYCKNRERLKNQNLRKGKSISINWPLWKEGGMQVDKNSEEMLFERFGFRPLQSENGIGAFELGLAAIDSQFSVLEGDNEKIRENYRLTEAIHKRDNNPEGGVDDAELQTSLQNDILNGMREILKLDGAYIDINKSIGDYGFDSVTFTEFSSYINKKYKTDIMPSYFFEYSSVILLQNYLLAEHREKIVGYYSNSIIGVSGKKQANNIKINNGVSQRSKLYENQERQSTANREKQNKGYEYNLFTNNVVGLSTPVEREPIAIIGISGVMPGAENLDEFWNNLIEGKDMIGEIPPDRWDWKEYYGDPLKEENKTTVKWGGFMKSIDKFDPSFFGISPVEAEFMDPQQRIFLETVWKAVEDAGYKASDISGSKTGVFVGAWNSGYLELMVKKAVNIHAYISSGVENSIIPNRISYLMDLHGPSIPVDTACSSSLVAIHMAVESLRNNQCDMAIAGGVNVILSPEIHVSASKAGMLSPDGRCKTFDSGANGYARGEGAGAVLLKRLSSAKRDRDHVYAVIKGTSVNHGGHANSMTSPNATAQAGLIVDAWKQSGIDPETVTYIEAHGTGTSLGDPIEINGLKKAFSELYANWNKEGFKDAHCALGSVKTNMGHLETAAGIAGLLKVLVSMKKGYIPGNLHFENQNPYISLENSPFYIVNKTRPWERLKKGENGDRIPRIAGISSFGFGGTNSHIVLEEYINDINTGNDAAYQPQVIVLSAKNEERLKNYAKDFLSWIKNHCTQNNVSIRDIAYTLQLGREEFEERVAFVAADFDEMARKLELYCQNTNNIDKFYRGNTRNKYQSDLLFTGKSGIEYVKTVIEEKEFYKLAKLWVMGVAIDWGILHEGHDAFRIPLPTYPFAREHYWLGEGIQQSRAVSYGGRLHPMVHVNVSNFSEQRFNTSLSGSEFYLKDHIVNNQKILPGVAYIEMARAAGEISGGKKVRYLKDIVWEKPIIVSNVEEKLDISLWIADDQVFFQITGGPANNACVNCSGKIVYDREIETENEAIDIALIRSRCTAADFSVFYPKFSQLGFAYGDSFRTLTGILRGKDECLAYLELPGCVDDTFYNYGLHPSIMDGVLQSAAGIDSREGETGVLYLPYAINGLEIIRPLEKKCVSYVTRINDGNKGIKKFNILVLNERGEILIRIDEFIMMPTLRKDQASKKNYEPADMLFKYEWKPVSIEQAAHKDESKYDFIVMENSDNIFNCIVERNNGKVLQIKYGNEFCRLNDHTIQINDRKEEDYVHIFECLQGSTSEKIKIIHAVSTSDFKTDEYTIENQKHNGFYSMVYLMKAYVKSKIPHELEILYIYESKQTYYDQPLYGAAGGFLKTASIEIPKLKYKTLSFGNMTEEEITRLIREEALAVSFSNNEVFYLSGSRMEKKLEKQALNDNPDNKPGFKPDGVYLITGGAGGLGLIFTEYISKNFGGNIILLGRSKLNEEKMNVLTGLRKNGADIHYLQCDITSYEDINNVLSEVRSRYKKINGIIHSAGVIRDSMLINKNHTDMELVLSPKINGAFWLDSLTVEDELDFFILFSSIAAVKGNMGQCDYSFANSVMDNFAAHRNHLAAIGQRRGRTVAINWPLWKEGGMRVDDKVEALLTNRTGMVALDTENGLEAFKNILAAGYEQAAYVRGIEEKMAAYFKTQSSDKMHHSHKEYNTNGSAGKNSSKLPEAKKQVVELCVELLKVREEDIDTDTPFIEYGLDSIMMIQMLGKMEERLGTIMESSVLAEFNTVEKLAQYIVEKGIIKEKVSDGHDFAQKSQTLNEKDESKKQAGIVTQSGEYFKTGLSKSKTNLPVQNDYFKKNQKIAVVGAACRFPNSNNIDVFWNHLINGNFLISEVPEDRWDMNRFYHPDKNVPYKSYSKWGGFLGEIYGFDAGYFSIHQEDALIMDPQHRMLLELAEELFLRSGYSKNDMAGTNTGVFIGASESPYFRNSMELVPDEYLKHAVVNSIQNMMAARISDFYDLKGPSQTVNTACSSSLVSIHQACQSIKTGESDMAVAGGIFLMMDPYYHIHFSKANVLSDDAKSYVFDERAKGFVLGEGAGIVLLKPYEKAVSDGDQIFGVILGSAINNDGHTMGLTVPNQEGQKDVIIKALKNAGVPADSISYLEAHGTGTLLGDPIEIRAAAQVFETYSSEKQYCAVGSVKSNMGHLMTSAGAAGFIKVILMLKNKMIPPTLNCSNPHPRFRFDHSPFYPVLALKNWTAYKEARRAAVSSFGFGGTNSHMILEEFNKEGYIPKRIPLKLPEFKRKYFRLGYEITEIPSLYK